jgi:hypothetical protein
MERGRRKEEMIFRRRCPDIILAANLRPRDMDLAK